MPQLESDPNDPLGLLDFNYNPDTGTSQPDTYQSDPLGLFQPSGLEQTSGRLAPVAKETVQAEQPVQSAEVGKPAPPEAAAQPTREFNNPLIGDTGQKSIPLQVSRPVAPVATPEQETIQPFIPLTNIPLPVEPEGVDKPGVRTPEQETLETPAISPETILIDIATGGANAARVGYPIIQNAVRSAVIGTLERPVVGKAAEMVEEKYGKVVGALTPLVVSLISAGGTALLNTVASRIQMKRALEVYEKSGAIDPDTVVDNIIKALPAPPGSQAAQKTIDPLGILPATPTPQAGAGTAPPVAAPAAPPATLGEGGYIGKGKTPSKPAFAFSDPAIEAEYKASGGIKKPSLVSRISDTLTELRNKVTREFEHLPKTGEFAPLRSDLLRLQKQKVVASDRTIGILQKNLKDLDASEYDLFSRKIILDDLGYEVAQGHELPYLFTPEKLAIERAATDVEVDANPKIVAALTRRTMALKEVQDNYIAAQSSIGFNVADRFKNPNYFRHQVLAYAETARLTGTGQRLRTPSGREFLKGREGSPENINNNYLQAEYEVLFQMQYDTEVARTIHAIDKKYNIAPRLKAHAKIDGDEDWHNYIPDTHSIWQPREGNLFYHATSIPENMAEELLTRAVEQLPVSREDLHKVIAMGRARKEYVLPNEVVDTLNNLRIPQSQNILSQAAQKILRGWKVWSLASPRRFAKYNLRNASGDAEAVFIGNPRAFKKSPAAFKELYNTMVKGEEPSTDLLEWFDMGGGASNLQVAELGDINKLAAFKAQHERQLKGQEIPMNLWKAYWQKAREITDFRESILRFAAYKDYKEQLIKNGGIPNNFGASNPKEVMELKGIKEKAFWLSNDLLGAYDKVSAMGQNLREYWLPFWSWKEVNFKRTIRLFQNAATDPEGHLAVGKAATAGLKASPYIAYRIGKFLVKAAGLWSILQVYNHLRYPKEEESLPTEVKSRPHLILGIDADGNVNTFNRLGAMGDFLETFGLDAAPKYVDSWTKGKKSLGEIATEMAKSPVNVFAQALTPLVKLPGEIVTGKTVFPDVTHPRSIKDVGQHVAQNLGLENEYKAVFGLPAKPYSDSLITALIYKTDPLEAAYNGIIFEDKADFLKKKGKYGEGSWVNPRTDALYNYKMSLKYKDKVAADKYLQEYMSLGGTQKSLQSSIDRMHPLSGLSKAEKEEFVSSLDVDSKRNLDNAIKFYNSILDTSRQVLPVQQPQKQAKSTAKTYRPYKLKMTRTGHRKKSSLGFNPPSKSEINQQLGIKKEEEE